MTDDSAANVPGADADGDSSVQNQGALSTPEKANADCQGGASRTAFLCPRLRRLPKWSLVFN